MILTKEEKTHIKIWRLLKEISVKQGEGYYSLETSPNDINKKYYLPKMSHCTFDSAEETIKSLENLLKMSKYEYYLDLEGMIKRLAKLKTEKNENNAELEELEKAYDKAIKDINK